jgi:hypothetical protein
MVEKFGVADPAPTFDDLLLQHGDVSGGTAEGRSAELQEEPGELPQ